MAVVNVLLVHKISRICGSRVRFQIKADFTYGLALQVFKSLLPAFMEWMNVNGNTFGLDCF